MLRNENNFKCYIIGNSKTFMFRTRHDCVFHNRMVEECWMVNMLSSPAWPLPSSPWWTFQTSTPSFWAFLTQQGSRSTPLGYGSSSTLISPVNECVAVNGICGRASIWNQGAISPPFFSSYGKTIDCELNTLVSLNPKKTQHLFRFYRTCFPCPSKIGRASCRERV